MKLLRDPFFHFVATGAILFAGYAFFNHSQTNPSTTDPVHISEGDLRWMRETFTSQWRRPPTTDELNGLVAAFLEEELFAREAKALGLDRNDTIVRRRLAQKLTFLVDDTSRLAEPTDEELRRFYDANAAQFRAEPRASFTQLFFNPGRRQDAELDARAALISISATGADGAAATSDPILVDADFHDVEVQTVSNVFGADFAREVFALKPGLWSGPIKSGLGIHLVRVTDLSPAKNRPFEEVQAKVLAEWRHRREGETRAAYLAKLREKYGVVVDDSVGPVPNPQPAVASSQ